MALRSHSSRSSRALRVDERAHPLRSPEVLGDAADIVDDVVDVVVGGTIVLQRPRHESPRPGLDGIDSIVRTGPARQRHGSHQSAPRGDRLRLAAAFVVPTTWWIQSIVEGGRSRRHGSPCHCRRSSSSSGSRHDSSTATTAPCRKRSTRSRRTTTSTSRRIRSAANRPVEVAAVVELAPVAVPGSKRSSSRSSRTWRPRLQPR